jgi:hypothetical protein
MPRKIVITEAGAPPGQYVAQFLGIKDTQHVEFGPGLCFEFQVAAGEYAGRKVSRITSDQPTLGNAAGKMLAGLFGRALEKDQELDPDQLVGREYVVTVEQGPSGGCRVSTVQPRSV